MRAAATVSLEAESEGLLGEEEFVRVAGGRSRERAAGSLCGGFANSGSRLDLADGRHNSDATAAGGDAHRGSLVDTHSAASSVAHCGPVARSPSLAKSSART